MFFLFLDTSLNVNPNVVTNNNDNRNINVNANNHNNNNINNINKTMSISCNRAMDADDTLSNQSEKRKQIIVKIVTVFSVLFFVICFAMIAFTLRMSERIDAEGKWLSSTFRLSFILTFFLPF